MDKNFTTWSALKENIDDSSRNLFFKERDVWWTSIGLNIGHEENGKNQFFTRPVLVVRKFNSHLFFGVPLTTKVKDNRYYHLVNFKGIDQCVMLSQFKSV